MDKKIAGLLGAAAALTITAAQAAVPTQSSQPAAAASYADLLTPVAQPVAALEADNARLMEAENTIIIRKKYRRHHHHHHHHHHHGAFIGIPGVAGVKVGH